jgi:hypothetical protein
MRPRANARSFGVSDPAEAPRPEGTTAVRWQVSWLADQAPSGRPSQVAKTQWKMTGGFPLTVAGAAAALDGTPSAPHSLFIRHRTGTQGNNRIGQCRVTALILVAVISLGTRCPLEEPSRMI